MPGAPPLLVNALASVSWTARKASAAIAGINLANGEPIEGITFGYSGTTVTVSGVPVGYDPVA